MVGVLLPKGIWREVLVVTLLVLDSQVASSRHTPEHFSLQAKSECYFVSGLQPVRFVDRFIYNGQEMVRFDSDVGKYEALMELGRETAEHWNRKQRLDYARAAVRTLCRCNSLAFEPFSRSWKVEPEVVVYPSKLVLLGHHNLLVCSVTGFYPGDIEVRWFLNGQEETIGVVSTGLISNGDWSYQVLVMLEMTPKSGDVYTCHVEHSSLQRPVILDWKAQSESAHNKMLSGVGGLVLGLIFLGIGFIVHQRRKKGNLG